MKFAMALTLPFAIITDWDPLDGASQPLGKERAIRLLNEINLARFGKNLDDGKRKKFELSDGILKNYSKSKGIFLNNSTFELEIASSPELVKALLSVLEEENLSSIRRKK